MAGSEATPFKLEKPPVKRVELTLRFAATPPIQGWHLASFFAQLRDRYLSVTETAPLTHDKDGLPFEFIPADGSWPIPRTEFVRPERSLAVQGDQMDVAWEFGDEQGEDAYVGFESLMVELQTVYHAFVAALDENDVQINPLRAQCLYVNEIGELTGGELAVGVLTDWAGVPPRPVPTPGYVGVRMHACASPEHQCSSYIMVDSREDDPPTMSISVRRTIREGDADPLVAMREAHEELIELFKRHTSDELRRGWGEL